MKCTAGDGRPGEMACRGGEFGACEATGNCREGATRDCATACGTGVQTCVGGSWAENCTAPKPQTEICDGQDNNCDGRVDETCGCQAGTSEACYDGAAATRGVGLCADGQHTCSNGTWSACAGQVLPATEKCDGLDNDCDGTVDNGCACQDGQKQSCTTACGAGQEVCVSGQWQNCDAPKPQQETCDGLDNNCDGRIDEVCSCVHGKTEPCWEYHLSMRNIGICKDGTRTCTAGVWSACIGQVAPELTENCNDNLDNNCNGAVNDGCTCTQGQVQDCGTDEGICQKGQQVCTNNAWGTCMGEVTGTTETCNGQDDDCDGQIDNGLDADSAESNDTCQAATLVNVDDTVSDPTTLSYTIYPTGDVDYLHVIAEDGSSIDLYCGFMNRKPQCHFLDVEIVGPSGTSAPYKASLMAIDCASAPFDDTDNAQNATGSIWHGRCVDDDSFDYWIKVEPKAGATPQSSCEPYELRLLHTSENYDCCTMIDCVTDADCWGENWGCGGCDTSTNTCRQRCEVTSCSTDADCAAAGCGTCSNGSCLDHP